MRKLLLATSALLGASVGIAGVASAGTLTPNAPNPAPGSITVTLNGLVEAFMITGYDSVTNAAANPPGTAGQKTADYGIATYLRLFPSFDGALASGLKYGASAEIRFRDGADGGSLDNTAYAQRYYVYMGADKFGKVFLGSPVQPSESFQTGNPANFNTGGWDGDVNGFFAGPGGLPYFFDDDNDTANKIVYVSPQFTGFDFGVSFEPNNYGRDYAKPFSRASSVPVGSPQFGLRRNTFDGAARYTGTFGPVGFKANIAGSVGGTVTSTSGLPGDPVQNYQNFDLYGGGVSVTYGGFELDGHMDAGKYGPDLNPIPEGASGTTAYIVGGSYTFGPAIVGAAFNGFNSGYTKAAGTGVGTANGFGVAAGGTYTLAPGVALYLEYLFGQKKATGYDFATSSAGTANNQTNAQAFGVGTTFKW